MSFYSRFFDINTEDFLAHVRSNIRPASKEAAEFDSGDNSPAELYGAIWITATLVFSMFVSSTASNLVSHWEFSDNEDPKYEYSFDLLTGSLILFYGYMTVASFAIFGLTRYKSSSTTASRISIVKLVSIYGYSNLLWFPLTGINFLLMVFINPKKNRVVLNALQWATVMITGIISAHGLFIRVKPIVAKELLPQSEPSTEDESRIRKSVLIPLLLVHLGFAALVKISFFGLK